LIILEKKIFSVFSLDKDIGGISKMIELSTKVLSNNNNNKINLFLIDKSATEKSLSEVFKKKNITIKKLSIIEKNLLKLGYLRNNYKKDIFESDIIFLHNYKLVKHLKRYLDFKPFILFFHTDKEKQIYGLEKIKKVLTVNSFTMKLINKKYKAEIAKYLPNCIDTRNKKLILKNSKKEIIVGAMGRLVEKKGFESLINVFKRLKGIHLHIAGDGPLMSFLGKKAYGYNNIKLLGWIKDKNEFFKKIDIFFCSSYIEPFGLVILEAMLNGVPVISTKCRGPLDIIEHMKNGILVNIDNKYEMEKAVRLLEKDKLLRKQISKNAFETLKDKYSIQVYKKNLFSEIKKIL
tara:strand:+ start:194 stop:1237 length:1044 start_codon:yes stop_codon:yes gene_type:complete